MKDCLHIVSDIRSSFEDLLDKDKSFSIQVKNVQKLALQMFTVAKDLSAPIVEHPEFVSI